MPESNPKKHSQLLPISGSHSGAVHLHPHLPVERELKFILPVDVVAAVQQCGLEYETIAQHYFPRSLVPAVARKLLSLHGFAAHVRDGFSSARLRSIRTADGIRYTVAAKSTKQARSDGLFVERNELEVESPSDVALGLLRRASLGSLVKLRYNIPGWIKAVGQTKVHAELSLDVILGGGLTVHQAEGISSIVAERPSALDPLMVSADLEVNDWALAEAVISGNHSWRMLDEAIAIHDLDSEIAKKVSARSIAKRGISPKLVRRFGCFGTQRT